MSPGTLASLGLARLAAMPIALVDAQPARRDAVGRRLATAGFRTVLTAGGVDNALQLLAEHSNDDGCDVDLVIVCERLLAEDGQRLASIMEWHPAWRHLPLLALSARDRVPVMLLAHDRIAGLCDVVCGEDTENLLARVIAGLKLRIERRRNASASDMTDAIIMLLDPQGRVQTVNRGGCALLGYAPDELAGRDWFRHCIPGADSERRLHEFGDALRGGADTAAASEHRVVTLTGEERIIAWRYLPWRNPAGDVEGLLCSGHDVTERNRMRDQLRWHLGHDLLTGVLNRSEFEARLVQALEQARGGDVQHALAYLDLDQFKVINDTCGHSAGDELLRQLAGLLPQRVRRRDTLARLGGDEFGVLMEHCSLEQAKRVANGLRRTVADYRFVWDGKTFGLGVSIGVVPITGASERVAGVLAAADAACYAAKDQGRNRV
ncbi:MAG: diguanylate cyclase, partial [Planctomycetes bacterium]|nr:diguanylate cyclase [Planctomycetota bacterium]